MQGEYSLMIRREIDAIKNKFEGITFVASAICHHSIGPFLFLKDYIDVKVFAEKIQNYRSLNVDTKNLKIYNIKNDNINNIVSESRNRLIFTWGGAFGITF